MATAYTKPIYDDRPITFEQFVWRCARAFGALASQRYESLDASVRFGDDSDTDAWVERLGGEISEYEARLEELRALDPAVLAARVAAEHERAREVHASRIAHMAALRMRYEAMLARVEAWEPPAEYLRLREFMVEQLRDSMKFDCYDIEAPALDPDPDAWRAREVRRLERNITECKAQRERLRSLRAQHLAWCEGLARVVPVDAELVVRRRPPRSAP